MKTTLRSIAVTIGLAAVLGSAALIANEMNQAIAKIPFDFQVAGKTLPAGEYRVSRNPQTATASMQNMATGHSTLMLTSPGNSGTGQESKLVFNHAGDEYALSEIWLPGVMTGYKAPTGKRSRADGERGFVATVRLIQK